MKVRILSFGELCKYPLRYDYDLRPDPAGGEFSLFEFYPHGTSHVPQMLNGIVAKIIAFLRKDGCYVFSVPAGRTISKKEIILISDLVSLVLREKGIAEEQIPRAIGHTTNASPEVIWTSNIVRTMAPFEHELLQMLSAFVDSARRRRRLFPDPKLRGIISVLPIVLRKLVQYSFNQNNLILVNLIPGQRIPPRPNRLISGGKECKDAFSNLCRDFFRLLKLCKDIDTFLRMHSYEPGTETRITKKRLQEIAHGACESIAETQLFEYVSDAAQQSRMTDCAEVVFRNGEWPTGFHYQFRQGMVYIVPKSRLDALILEDGFKISDSERDDVIYKKRKLHLISTPYPERLFPAKSAVADKESIIITTEPISPNEQCARIEYELGDEVCSSEPVIIAIREMWGNGLHAKIDYKLGGEDRSRGVAHFFHIFIIAHTKNNGDKNAFRYQADGVEAWTHLKDLSSKAMLKKFFVKAYSEKQKKAIKKVFGEDFGNENLPPGITRTQTTICALKFNLKFVFASEELKNEFKEKLQQYTECEQALFEAWWAEVGQTLETLNGQSAG